MVCKVSWNNEGVGIAKKLRILMERPFFPRY